jgi:hypothetical protein
MAEQIQNQITIFNVEFQEEDDRYTLRINPAITKTQKYHLTELINSVDNALYTVKSSYVMKDSYLELTALLEDNNYTYVTIIVDVKLLSKDKTAKQLLYAIQDPFLIQIEQKLTVASLTFIFKPDVIDIIKTIKGRFWSKEDSKWYVPITEVTRVKNKITNHNSNYKFEDVLTEYQINQSASEEII